MSKKKKKQQPPGTSARGSDGAASLSASAGAVQGERAGVRSAVVTPSPVPVLDDGPEPSAGKAGLPVLLIALLGLGIYLADAHMSNRGGEFNELVYYPYTRFDEVVNSHPMTEEEKVIRKGRETFNFVCAACHQSTGLGVPGQFPPLAGSDWVLGEGPNRIIRIVLNGIQGPIDVKGQAFNNAMPAQKDVLKDEQIAAVLTFIRNQWGNKAPPVTVEQVKKVREAEKARDAAWSADELKKLPEKE